jgi:hypothetical protein
MWKFLTKSLWQRPRDIQKAVIARPTHFEISRGDDIIVIPYADVLRVEVYKTDDFTVDTIWVQIDTPSGSYHANEDHAGFVDAIEGLGKRLPEFVPDWYVRVTAETFEENRTVLYQAPWP